MNSFFARVFLMAAIVAYSSSAQAGWFDNKKSDEQKKMEEKARVEVERIKEVLPVKIATPEPVRQSVSATVPTAPSSPAKRNAQQFLDVGPNSAKWSSEAAADESERKAKAEKGRLFDPENKTRLSEEEAQELKEEMNRIRRDVSVAQSVKGLTQLKAAKEQVASLPAIPKAPVAPVQAPSYKNSKPAGVTGGYKASPTGYKR